MPAAKVFNANADGKKMGKPITKIREYDGKIAFEFMGGDVNAGIDNLVFDMSEFANQPVTVYDVTGKLFCQADAFDASQLPSGKTYIIKNKKGKTIKINR